MNRPKEPEIPRESPAPRAGRDHLRGWTVLLLVGLMLACWTVCYGLSAYFSRRLGWRWPEQLLSSLVPCGTLGGLGALIGWVFCLISKRVPARVIIWGAILGTAVGAALLL